jgi:hypothetical protein
MEYRKAIVAFSESIIYFLKENKPSNLGDLELCLRKKMSHGGTE